MILIRPATMQDAEIIGTHLRPDDEREVQTSTGQPGAAVVPLALQTSREAYTVWRVIAGLPRIPIAMFGVTNGTHGSGVVWFLGTDDIRSCSLAIVRESRKWLDHMSRHYVGLYNFADLRNDLHIRWCKLTGFTLGDTTQLNGSPFVFIHRSSPCVLPS